MPRKRTYSLVTVNYDEGGDITGLNVAEGLSHSELIAYLSAPAPSGRTVERRVFGGDEIKWEPTVRLGVAKATKAAKPPEKKSTTRKPRESKPPTGGTRFEETGAKAPQQGEAHGTGA